MATGLPPPQSALAVVASGGVERQQQGGRRINNIGLANVVILKWPTLQVTIPATGTAAKPLAQQPSQKLEELNEKITQPPSFSLPLSEDDDEIGDSTIAKGDSYGLRGVLYLGQDQHIQFEKQDDGAHDQPPFLPRPEQADKVQDDRFQTEPFLETPVPLLVLQCLDQSPKSEVQLA